MARTLAGLKAKTHTFTAEINVGDEHEPDLFPVRVTYRAHAFDEALEEAVAPLAEASRMAAVVREVTIRVIDSWDLKADDDATEPVPLTPEGLKDIPSDFLELLLEAIKANRRPNPATANGS
jgi:hypothetical protein